MIIKIIGHNDSILTDVMALGKKNAKTLGLFPRDAFIDHAKKRNIIVATDNNELLGYLLFRITQSKGVISIAHLCIDADHRNKGIAKALMIKLKETYRNLFRGIMLNCRKDYVDASKFYERSEFKAIKEVRSRSQQEKYLVKWYYDFGNVDLFTSTHLSSNKINVLLDASVLIKLRDEPTLENQEAHSLNADWLNDEIDLFYAPEIFNEINRDTNRDRAAKTREFLNSFSKIAFNPDERNTIASDLVTFIPGDSENDASDRIHVAECIAGGLNYFITTDDKILGSADSIFTKYSVRILRPTELILFIDQLKNKSDYYSFRVAGANYEYKKLEQFEINTLIEAFLQKGTEEKKHEFRTILTTVVTDVKNSLIRLVKDDQGKYLGFFAIQINDNVLNVNAIRTNKNKISEVLFYQLLNDVVQYSVDKNINVINLLEKNLSEEMMDILSSYGFEQKNNIWIKITLSGMLSSEELFDNHEILKDTWDINVTKTKFDSLIDKEKEHYKLELERKLWPLKLIDIDIPTYIVPIKTFWASQLFDHYQSNHSFFGSKAEVAWQRENIYYRNVNPVSEKVPARILWYVSTDNKNMIGRHKGIVACSYLDEVHIHEAKTLYQKFKSFGIYEWKHVIETANNDISKQMKALKFSDTEVFRNHIPFNVVSNVMIKNGRRQNTFASPVEVSKEIFNDIYKIGKELT